MRQTTIELAGKSVQPGERKTIHLPAVRLHTHTPIEIPVHILHGKHHGPVLFITAALHGDEINGVEIIRRILASSRLKNLHGTLIAIPISNLYGFINLSRYLPDRRDLNRCFPGSPKGSLGSRITNLILEEIISKSTYGIDLHTGAIHRENLPQIRINTKNTAAKKLARAFNPPVIVNSSIRPGSLREACDKLNIPVLVYEAGEALRFNEYAIRAGTLGVLRVMTSLGMIKSKTLSVKPKRPTAIAKSSTWVRAPESGLFHPTKRLGHHVKKGEAIGIIADPYGKAQVHLRSDYNGVIIGRTNLPIINEGDAIMHIASFSREDIIELQEDLHTIVELPTDDPLALQSNLD